MRLISQPKNNKEPKARSLFLCFSQVYTANDLHTSLAEEIDEHSLEEPTTLYAVPALWTDQQCCSWTRESSCLLLFMFFDHNTIDRWLFALGQINSNLIMNLTVDHTVYAVVAVVTTRALAVVGEVRSVTTLAVIQTRSRRTRIQRSNACNVIPSVSNTHL